MKFLKTDGAGEIQIDHRASPGIPTNLAASIGMDPALLKEGSVLNMGSYGCNHCGAHVILNPDRSRAREWCSVCDRHICDWCGAARKEPGYIHRTIDEISDMVMSGKWNLSGSMCRPTLTLTCEAIIKP